MQLVLSPGSGYLLGPLSNDVLVIHDTVLPTVSLSAIQPNAVVATAPPASSVVTRNSTAGDLTVHYTVGGTASPDNYLEPLADIAKQNFDALKPGRLTARGAGSPTVGTTWSRTTSRSRATHCRSPTRRTTPTSSCPRRRPPPSQLNFDFQLQHDIHDYVGTPNVTLQDVLMEADGPNANAKNEFLIVYRATTDQFGNVNFDQVQIRGADTIYRYNSPDAFNGVRRGSGTTSDGPELRRRDGHRDREVDRLRPLDLGGGDRVQQPISNLILGASGNCPVLPRQRPGRQGPGPPGAGDRRDPRRPVLGHHHRHARQHRHGRG